jgi:hypothetical protein
MDLPHAHATFCWSGECDDLTELAAQARLRLGPERLNDLQAFGLGANRRLGEFHLDQVDLTPDDLAIGFQPIQFNGQYERIWHVDGDSFEPGAVIGNVANAAG